MTLAYEPVPYWRARGAVFAEQELAFIGIVGRLPFTSVLDVGCGPGRLGGLLRGLHPDIAYTGLDVSPDMLSLAEVRVPGGEFYETGLMAFRPDRQWDLVVASEFLMHFPPALLDAAIRRLAELASGHIVTIDWTAAGVGASHNFRHDYEAAFASAGLCIVERRRVHNQTIHVVTRCAS